MILFAIIASEFVVPFTVKFVPIIILFATLNPPVKTTDAVPNTVASKVFDDDNIPDNAILVAPDIGPDKFKLVNVPRCVTLLWLLVDNNPVILVAVILFTPVILPFIVNDPFVVISAPTDKPPFIVTALAFVLVKFINPEAVIVFNVLRPVTASAFKFPRSVMLVCELVDKVPVMFVPVIFVPVIPVAEILVA